MARSLFDPHKAAGAEPPKAVGAGGHFTVSQVAELIKTTLETRLPSPLKVVGQVSNLRPQNHWYFSLKDEQAVLACVAWATAAKKFGFVPKDGDEVVATGHISHFGPQGKTQMYVDALQPVGAGALELKFRAMCEQLRGLGYFEEERKRPLPMFPRCVAVITSKTSAALTDVIATAAQRCKAVKLLVIDVRVQGDGAAEDIARAIKWVDAKRVRLGVDAMLVTRGGGSIEDLWAFNERIVADAVFKCRLPVVAAIGHESDTTIIELVADVRASTPTQAVMRLVPSSIELNKQIEHLTHRLGALLNRTVEQQFQRQKRLKADLGRIVRSHLSQERARLERLATQLAHARPTAQLAQRQARLAVLKDRLHRAMLRRIDVRERPARFGKQLQEAIKRHVRFERDRLNARRHHLAAIDPQNVLKRGFSITRKANGTIVKSVRQVKAMERITTLVSDGGFESVVRGKDNRGRSMPQVTDAAAGQADQLDLFRSGS